MDTYPRADGQDGSLRHYRVFLQPIFALATGYVVGSLPRKVCAIADERFVSQFALFGQSQLPHFVTVPMFVGNFC
jgi:hypothetical protein